MIERLIIAICAVAAIGGISGCASIAVVSDVNTGLAHTVACHSFSWAGSFHGGPLAVTLANPVNEARLRSAIETHLQGLGMRSVAAGGDCLVGYGIGTRGVLEDWSWGGWGPGWGNPYWGGPYFYPEAVVAVDLYDGHSRQPVWHAYARQRPSELSGERAAQGIDAAIAAIFTKYPG